MWLIPFLLLVSAACASSYNDSIVALTTAHYVEVAAAHDIYGIFDKEADDFSFFADISIASIAVYCQARMAFINKASLVDGRLLEGIFGSIGILDIYDYLKDAIVHGTLDYSLVARTQYLLLENPSLLSLEHALFAQFNVIKLRDYVLLPCSNLQANVLIVTVRGAKDLLASTSKKPFIHFKVKMLDLTCDDMDDLDGLKELTEPFSGLILDHGKMDYYENLLNSLSDPVVVSIPNCFDYSVSFPSKVKISNLYFCNGIEFMEPVYGFLNKKSCTQDGLTFIHFPFSENDHFSIGFYPFYLSDLLLHPKSKSDSVCLTDLEKLIIFDSFISLLSKVYFKSILFGLHDGWNIPFDMRFIGTLKDLCRKIDDMLHSHPVLQEKCNKDPFGYLKMILKAKQNYYSIEEMVLNVRQLYSNASKSFFDFVNFNTPIDKFDRVLASQVALFDWSKECKESTFVRTFPLLQLPETLEIDINDDWLMQKLILDEPHQVEKLVIKIPSEMKGLERIQILQRNFISSKVNAKFITLAFEMEIIMEVLEFFHDWQKSGHLTVNEIRLNALSKSSLVKIVEYFGDSLQVSTCQSALAKENHTEIAQLLLQCPNLNTFYDYPAALVFAIAWELNTMDDMYGRKLDFIIKKDDFIFFLDYASKGGSSKLTRGNFMTFSELNAEYSVVTVGHGIRSKPVKAIVNENYYQQ